MGWIPIQNPYEWCRYREGPDRGNCQEVPEYGNASGGLCVQKMGGIPALPYKEDIEAYVNSYR